MRHLLSILKALMERGFMFLNTPVNLDSLQDRLLEINQAMTDIVNTAEAEERDLTDEEVDQLKAFEVEFKASQERITRIENLQKQQEKLREGMGRQTTPNDPDGGGQPAPQNSGGQPRIEVQPHATRGNHGFRNIGEFAMAVRGARGGSIDPRLIKNAPTTYGTEGIGADGGFAVPPDFRTEIKEKVMGEESLLGRTDQMETSSNSLTLPKDETTPWQSSGGVLAYWESEAGALTESKPALESVTYKTNKVTALVPVTEELLEDAPSLDGYLRRKVPEKFDYKIQNAIIQGTGAGQPLGILNSGCLTSVAKESAQSADTVVFGNIVNMFSRMYAPCVGNAVWLINQDILPQLMQMEFPSSNSGTYPAWMPPGMLASAPNGALMGRPIIPLQGCNTLGDKGDIILADLTKYLTVIKSGGVRADVSMHLYFDYDMLAYRFVMRLTGQPWWRTYITPASGSTNYLSCFVTLDERA